MTDSRAFTRAAYVLLAGVLALYAAYAVFLARGIVGYTAWWATMTPEPNFRLNDRRVYSPLCLFLGLGFLVLIYFRLT